MKILCSMLIVHSICRILEKTFVKITTKVNRTSTQKHLREYATRFSALPTCQQTLFGIFHRPRKLAFCAIILYNTIMNKTLGKTSKILCIVLGAIASVFLLLYAGMFFAGLALYGEARSLRKYVCVVPATSTGFAPQGITYCGDDTYIHTGYGDDNRSLLYIVKGENERRVRILDEDGAETKGHAGGVTRTGNYVYIANGHKLMMYELDKLIAAADNPVAAADNPVAAARIIPVDNTAAFCYSDDKNLYVGEFYREQNYKTDSSHHYETPNGDGNKAIVSCYRLDENGLLSGNDEQPYPEYCISVPDLVQGFAVKDGVIVLSRSYGLTNSALDYHGATKDSGRTIPVSFKLNQSAPAKTVPLYYIDKSTLFRSLVLPSFSEDITIVDDRVIVTNEASANKYFVGKLFGANKVYSYPLFKPES